MAKNGTKKIIRQVLPILLLTGLFNLGAGSLLGGMEEQMGKYLAGTLVMVPPLMALKGNITGTLASRLGSGLHQGLIDSGNILNKEVKTNVYAAITLSIITAITIGTLSTLITVLFTETVFTLSLLAQLISVAVIAATLSVILLSLISVAVSILSYRRGWDPDNITSPVLTTLGDILSIGSLYVALMVVLNIAGSI